MSSKLTAIRQLPVLSDDLRELLSDETLELLERRRRNWKTRRRGWLIRRLLLVADVTGIAVAFLIAELAFGKGGTELAFGEGGGSVSPLAEFLLFLATLPLWVVGSKLYGLYDQDEERTDHSTTDEVVTVFHFLTVGTWLLFAIAWVSWLAVPAPVKLTTFWASAIVLVSLGRIAARALARRSSAYLQNTVVVGASGLGQTLARKVLKHPEYGLNLLGFVDTQASELPPDLARYPLLAAPDRLPAITRALEIERVIVAYPFQDEHATQEMVYALQDLDIQVDVVPRFDEIIGTGVNLHTVEGLTLVGLPPFRLSNSSAALKRAMDVSVAAVTLAFALPFMLLAALLIKLDSRGPVLFKQVRRGKGGRLFELYKFRTMIAGADERKEDVAHLNKHVLEGGDPRMFKIEHDPRVTRVGRHLRRYMIDELPQLLNVLKGDMSLVGPRPLILEEDRFVERWGRKRLDLKPGMTGLWQVLGRQAISFEEMVKLDYLYVTTWSLGADFRLLLRTLPIVLKGEGGAY